VRAAGAPPLCAFCEIVPVRSRVDRGPRKGEWCTHCSRQCGLAAVRSRHTPDLVEANARALRLANRARSQQTRTSELQQVFGELLMDRNRMVSVEQAVRLALQFGQKRWIAGRQAHHAAMTRRSA
jgi:hypothetical protein